MKGKREKGKGKRRNGKASGKDQNEKNHSVIYGVLPVLETVRAEKRKIEKILISEGAREKRFSDVVGLAREKGIEVDKISGDKFSVYVAEEANHQGIVALVASAEYADADAVFAELAEKIESGEKPLVVVLDGVEDPRNLGAILRVVECAGAEAVFIPERRAVGLTETVAKSSAGASEYVKVAKVTNINRTIEELKKIGIWTIGASGDGETSYTNWDWNAPCALVLGGEGKGLHRLTAEKCDMLVKIPMRGKVESLNVSVAAGVILFEAVRQRGEIE